MKFWGAEVKGGETLSVQCGEDFVLRLSQAALGEVKKEKANESACLYVKIDDKKLVLGTLSSDKFPQLAFDLVFDKDFELSHNLKNGSVYFAGFKVPAEPDEVDNEDFENEEDDLLVPSDTSKGKTETQPQAKQTNGDTPKANVSKPDSSEGKKKVTIVEPSKDFKPKKENDDNGDDDDETDETDDDEEEQEINDDQPMMVNEEDESDEEEDESDDESSSDDESDDEDEETPQKATELGKKRSADPAMTTPVPDKKAKLATPQKTDGKKVGGHVATPHPSKQVAKAPAATSSTGKSFICKSCNRTFGSDNALQSHTKAKHG